MYSSFVFGVDHLPYFHFKIIFDNFINVCSYFYYLENFYGQITGTFSMIYKQAESCFGACKKTMHLHFKADISHFILYTLHKYCGCFY